MRLLVLGLAFCAMATSAQAADPDDFSAAIDVGRFGVMLDQAASAEKLLAPKPTQAEPGRDTTYRQLVTTVLRFNVLADRLCAKSVLPPQDCTGPFAPAWLSAPPETRRDPVKLRAMIDEAGARIGTLWGDVCDRARSAGGDPHICDIE